MVGMLISPLPFPLTGVCVPDETTFKYVRERTDAEFEPEYSDGDAKFFSDYKYGPSQTASARVSMACLCSPTGMPELSFHVVSSYIGLQCLEHGTAAVIDCHVNCFGKCPT